MRVRVFRNLTWRCFSIQVRTPSGWRTAAHADSVRLGDVEFTVSQAGRQRTIETGRKQVHAWVSGDIVGWTGKAAPRFHDESLETFRGPRVRRIARGRRVTYQPFRFKGFVFADDERPVHQPRGDAHLSASGVMLAA